LDEEVYMEMPQGALKLNEKGKVMRLLKCIYGLKQAGRKWQRKLLSNLEKMGFHTSKVDHSMFIRHCGTETTIIPMSTDDMPVTGSSHVAIDPFKREVATYFDITDVGELMWMLGFEIRHDHKARTIAINQKAYLEAMAAKFYLTSVKLTHILLESGTDYNEVQCPDTTIDVPYQEACGSVLWPAVISHPDIAFAIGTLARFTQNSMCAVGLAPHTPIESRGM
jgi:hypothetical protein